MKRTLIHAYLSGNGMTDEITTYINLDPLEAARYYLNLVTVREYPAANGEFEEYRMKCTHVRTNGVQEWDGEKWKDTTESDPFAVGIWKTDGKGKYIHIAPYNQGGEETFFN